MPFTVLTPQDIIYASLLALLLTWLILTASRILKAVAGRTTEFNYHPKNFEAVMERCYFMFPNEHVRFNGSTFSRGMLVRVITNNNRTIEGKFIGINSDNIVCVVTSHSVVAQGIDDIEEISSMEERIS